ncbi:RHS repeat-associated core domain-containing protein [Pseudomonas fluorescens]|uniref:RHS repeat domain-containing protein n=1 Tax=Pseudomonas fluorescens TaxID=294 RepID=UPI00324CE645
MPATLSIHRHTPSLTTSDPRGLPVRAVGYWRDIDGVPPQARVNRTAHDWAGRAVAQWDPRLFLDASAPPNLQTVYALSGAVLSTNSVDAGWRVALSGEAGQPLHHWDGRGSQRRLQYDTQLRPESVFEQTMDGEAVCAERLSYGASDPTFAEHNQCGQLIRHDDPAGTQRFTEFGLHGAAVEQARHFLQALSLPDWPEPVADRELLLEPGEGAITRSHFNALGEVSHQTDAKGHRQLFHQTLDGQLRAVSLQLNGVPTPKTLLSAITYNAHGQTEREVAGNDVITTLEYDAQNGRLTRLQAQRGNEARQDLHYAYDPVGNVLSIEDVAQPIRYFANQRIEPVNRYAYDSLSQLIEATGWEAGGANKGPQFSTFDDPAPRANYRQTYHYDTGGNLLELTHEGPQSHGHRLVAAAHSNRCLPVLEGMEPGEDDFRRGFDGNGNLLNLQPGQALAWDLRNQLGEVRPVVRDSGLNDREHYVYGADGMRLRKVRETLAHARTLIAETRFLPNLELRNDSGTGEMLQVINVQTGRSSVRVLHWESEPPKDMGNDQYRYHLTDHLGSCTLELDDDGEVISQERYHPYGTTAWFAGRGEVEASYRTVRYSGKERDATGLYYYGFRYYVAGWQRWLNPDPEGSVDGLDLFAFLGGNPLSYKDIQGTNKIYVNALNADQKKSIQFDGREISPISELNDDVPGFKIKVKPVFREVNEELYNALLHARDANMITKLLLGKGAPNQIVDLLRGDLSPLEMVLEHKQVRESENRVQAAIASGIGACGEHARITFNLLASAQTTQPVFRVSAKGVDHGFSIIGDLRELPFDKVVVVDAWPIFPRAHTLDVGQFEVDVIRETALAEADPKYSMDDAKLLDNSKLDFPDGSSMERIREIGKIRNKYMQLLSIKDEYRKLDYMFDNDFGGFDLLPRSYVFDRVKHVASYVNATNRY